MSAHNVNDFDTLIFDLGGVVFGWSAVSTTAVTPRVLQKMLSTPYWYDFEKGTESELETYVALAKAFTVLPSDVEEAICMAKETLTSRQHMVYLIRALRPGRKIYAMTNMSAPTWEFVKASSSDWDIFDAVFTSAAAGMRKPNQGFYQHVIQQTGANPERTIFVDDQHENLISARLLGFTTVFYDTFENVERSLHNLCGDPVMRAGQFLARNAKRHLCYTDNSQTIHENYCQLLILEATNDPSIVDYTTYKGEFNFFRGHGEFTDSDFPTDLDTTSIAFTVIPDVVDHACKTRVMDKMLDYFDCDGIPLTYFDNNRPRRDHAVVANVLTLFHSCGRAQDVTKALDWVHLILKHRAYLEGTRYYLMPEVFLYFMSRFLFSDPAVMERLGGLYRQCVQERIGTPGDDLALAMRVHCCNAAGLDAKMDLERLLSMQQLDGGWEGKWFYKYGMKDFKVGNRGLATAIAQRAIRESRAIATPTSFHGP